MKAVIKTLLGRVIFAVRLHRLLLRDAAVIVLFHRIDDRYPEDPLTCSLAEFRRYCDFLQQYFDVVPLSQLVGDLERGDAIGRKAAITFDDGYLDNYRVAAPELTRRGLSACFFVTTQFLGSDTNAWWDAENSIQSEWMSWHDVRALRNAGFEVGPHTETHADLGAITGEDAVREVVESKTRVEEELSIEAVHFAYPYGGRAQMSEQNRELVASAGFQSCLSAYGGAVHSTSDPLRLSRFSVTPWFLSPYQLGFELISSAFAASAQSRTAPATPTRRGRSNRAVAVS